MIGNLRLLAFLRIHRCGLRHTFNWKEAVIGPKLRILWGRIWEGNPCPVDLSYPEIMAGSEGGIIAKGEQVLGEILAQPPGPRKGRGALLPTGLSGVRSVSYSRWPMLPVAWYRSTYHQTRWQTSCLQAPARAFPLYLSHLCNQAHHQVVWVIKTVLKTQETTLL